jgi:hypothetical protein
MDEGGGRDIPVGGEGMGGTELTEDLDEQGNDSLRTRTLSSSRAVIIIIRGAIRILTRGGAKDKQFKKLRREAINTRDSAKGEASDCSFYSGRAKTKANFQRRREEEGVDA